MDNVKKPNSIETAVRDAVQGEPRSVRSVVDDLKRKGIDDGSARAALRSLVDRGELTLDRNMKLAKDSG